MDKYFELNRLAEAAGGVEWKWWDSNSTLRLTTEINGRHGADGDAISAYRDSVQCPESIRAFIEAASPYMVKALIAENDWLRESDQETTELCGTLSVLLGDIAVAVRGPEEPKSRHGFHDLPSRVKTVVEERDQLKAENEIFEEGMRSLASTLGAGGYNAETLTATQLVEKVQWGVDHLADTSGHLADQLRAEVAGLRTGYEAYEQVNAGLKAENQRLRSGMKGDYDLDAWLEWTKEAEGLRKDAEQWRALVGRAKSPVIGYTGCVICGAYTDHGGLPCPNMRITAQSDLPETRSGQLGAALGQGEQS